MTARKHEQDLPTRPADNQDSFSLVSNEKLIQIYTAMLRCRLLTEHVLASAEQDNAFASVRAASGKEAVIAGVGVDLCAEDTLSCAAADAGAYLTKGIPLDAILRQVITQPKTRGRKRGSRTHAELPLHGVLPEASSLAARLNIACGVALANRMAKNGRIAVAYCDLPTEPVECWRDPLGYAGANRLPILFVCNCDSWIGTDVSPAHAKFEEISAISHSCGVPAITVDGHDAVAVYRVAYESITRARQGRGPTLIACRTDHHHLVHYLRTKFKGSSRRTSSDPIRAMETYLTRKGLFKTRLKRQIKAAFNSELDSAAHLINR